MVIHAAPFYLGKFAHAAFVTLQWHLAYLIALKLIVKGNPAV